LSEEWYVVVIAVCSCYVADGIQLVCADDSQPAVRVALLTNKSTAFHTVRLPVSLHVMCVLHCT